MLVASAFFFILWRKNWVLFAPVDYGGQTNVADFTEAMQRKSLNEQHLYAQIQQTVRETLLSSQVVTQLKEVVSQQGNQRAELRIENILSDAAKTMQERIRDIGFLTIDSRPLLGANNGRVWQVPYDQYATASELLDDIWRTIRPMPAYSYRELWVLRDSKTGRLLKDIGTSWARTQGARRDERSLEQIGIMPGMILEIVLMSKV